MSQGYARKCARDEKQVYVAQIWSKDISQGYGLVSLCGIPFGSDMIVPRVQCKNMSQGYAGKCLCDKKQVYIAQICTKDMFQGYMVKSHCLGSHLAGIWLSQGYNSRIYPRNMRENVPGTRSRYMSHRYAAKICPRDIVKSQSLHCQMLG